MVCDQEILFVVIINIILEYSHMITINLNHCLGH